MHASRGGKNAAPHARRGTHGRGTSYVLSIAHTRRPPPAPPSAHELEETRQASQTVAISSRCATGPRVHKVVERAGLLALL